VRPPEHKARPTDPIRLSSGSSTSPVPERTSEELGRPPPSWPRAGAGTGRAPILGKLHTSAQDCPDASPAFA